MRLTLFYIIQKLCSVHLPIKGERRSHAVATECGHKSDGLPMPLRHTADQALAAPATAAQPHHLGIGGGLVDEHKVRRIKYALFSHPAPACPRDVRALLLRRAQAFF